MKHCDDCNQEKPYEPSAAPRSKASGFYGWQCWDCYKNDTTKRVHKRKDIQDPEYVGWCVRAKALTAELRLLKAQIKTRQEAAGLAAKEARKKALAQARRAKPRALHKDALSLPYGELVVEKRAVRDHFLKTFPEDHPDYADKKYWLDYNLACAEKKLALYGPYEFDVAAKIPEKYKETHE